MQATRFPTRSPTAPQNKLQRAKCCGEIRTTPQASNPNKQTSPTQTPRKRPKPPPAAAPPPPISPSPSPAPVFLHRRSFHKQPNRKGGGLAPPSSSGNKGL